MSALLLAFYRARVSLKFWAFGVAYTIVRFRHIGIDIATTGDVPALLGGRVVRVKRTPQMGYVVVIKVGPLYFCYCHLADTDHLPKEGDRVSKGEVIGRLAWNKIVGHVGYGGSLWTGPHLHFVVTTHPDGAYSKVGARYFNPAPLIRDALTIPKKRVPQLTTSSTTIYSAPDHNAPAVDTYEKSEKVTTLGDKIGSYERVLVGGVIGYVLASRLVWRMRRVNAKKGLNLRTLPTTSSKSRVLLTIPDKTPVEILATDGLTDGSKWAKVRIAGKVGWVARKYLA